MQLNTKNFGEIVVPEDKILSFDDGIPSFESVKKYILLDNGDNTSPFRWLQSIDEPTLAFAIVNPFLIKKDYDINIGDDTVKQLGIEKEEEVEVYAIVVVPSDISKMTMNLKAPVIINTKNMKGAQVILDTDKYGVRHYIIEELRRREVAEDAGTDKKKEQTIVINDNIEVTIIDIQGDQVRIGINAPRSVSIFRKEIFLEIQEENKKAAEIGNVSLQGLLNKEMTKKKAE